MRKNTFLLLAVFLALQLAACKKGAPGVYTNTLQMPYGTTTVIQAHNQFATSLFKAQLQYDSVSGNTLISPLSIYLSLSMAYNGANGATRDSIAKALQLTGIDINMVNDVCKALIEQLPGEDSRVQLSIANSAWYTNAIHSPLAPFLNTISTDYHATCQSLNFSDPASVSVINNWVLTNTNGKIPKIIDAINSDEILFLINAIYFKGIWQYGFPTANTYNDQFYQSNGTAVQTAFMKESINSSIYQSDQFTMVELPYGAGNGFSMYILSPKNNTENVRSFVQQLDPATLSSTLAAGSKNISNINLTMPKWEYSYSINNLVGPLSRLGMGVAFSNGADFSNMYPQAAHISRVTHKAYIKTDESGSEAAAATVTGIRTSVVALPYSLQLDHPFVYLIAEKQSGAILFLGTIENPASH